MIILNFHFIRILSNSVNALAESREMQKNLEANIRKKMKKFGDEKYFILNSPTNEILKGYPEIENKWIFGEKEVVVPKAARANLFHGWKKWREDTKKDLKSKLLEDVEFGKKYVAERQEKIHLDRDRVFSKTWYNEERNRWEMEPIAVPYAVSRKLLENARIRHDWAAMFITLKGDDKEYYVDLKVIILSILYIPSSRLLQPTLPVIFLAAALEAVLEQFWQQFWSSFGAFLQQFWSSLGAFFAAVLEQFWHQFWQQFCS